MTPTEIAALGPGLAAGSLDFGYTWDSGVPPVPDFLSPTGYDDQYVYAGAATLDITPTPEPGTALLWFTGVMGLAAFWALPQTLHSKCRSRRDPRMKKIKLVLCVSAALFAPVLVGTSVAQAQNAQWTRNEFAHSGHDCRRAVDTQPGWIIHQRRCVRRTNPLLHPWKQRRRHRADESDQRRQHI